MMITMRLTYIQPMC